MIHIDRNLIQEIRAHGGWAYPHECCGALLGHSDGGEKKVMQVLPVENSVPENSERRYLITPEAYRRIEREADGQGLEFLGLYHSHPDHPSRPSQFDLDHAMPCWSYIIVSVAEGRPEGMHAWVLREDRSGFDEEEFVTDVAQEQIARQT